MVVTEFLAVAVPINTKGGRITPTAELPAATTELTAATTELTAASAGATS